MWERDSPPTPPKIKSVLHSSMNSVLFSLANSANPTFQACCLTATNNGFTCCVTDSKRICHFAKMSKCHNETVKQRGKICKWNLIFVNCEMNASFAVNQTHANTYTVATTNIGISIRPWCMWVCVLSVKANGGSHRSTTHPPNEIETVCNAYGTGLTTYFPHSTKCCVAGTLAIVEIDTQKSQKRNYQSCSADKED